MTAQPPAWDQRKALARYRITTLPRYWITRLYVALAALSSTCAIWWEPEALAHRLIDQSGRPGWWLVGLLAVVAVVAICDVVINDLAPDSLTLRCTKRVRHVIYIGLSLGLACIAFVFIAGGGGWWRPLAMPLLVDAAMAALVAFLDLFQRHKDRQ